MPKMRYFLKNFRAVLVLALCLGCGQPLSAQFVSGEYFFDTDPGVGLATKFTVPEEVFLDGQFEFPTDGLEEGTHQLGVRIKNENIWSFTQLIDFYIEPNTFDEDNTRIVAAEYFIGNDPGNGQATPITVAAGERLDDEFDLSTPELSPGSYKVGVRIKGDNGVWGLTQFLDIEVVPEEGVSEDFIKEFEFAIVDSEGDTVKTGKLSLDEQQVAVDDEFDIDLSGLAPDTYELQLKALNDQNVRGPIKRFSFVVIDGNAPTAISISSAMVDEKKVVGTVVGELSTTDPDASETHTYELVAGDGDTDNASFEISGNQLLTKEVFDFSTKSQYTVRIKTTDLGELSFEQAIAITINDVKDEQTITFEAIGADTYGSTETLSATSSAGLEITYESSDTQIATIEGNVLTLVGVGDVTISASQAGNDNFLAAQEEQNLSVGKAALTTTADSKTKTYSEQNPELTISYSGFKFDDSESDITAPTVSTSATETSDAGEYAISLSGGSATNYEFTKVDGVLTINQATLTAMADAKMKTYGEQNPALTISYSGFKLDDSEANITAPSASTEATETSGAGEYAIALSGGSATNYEITRVAGALTITKASLTATADDKNRVYGDANPALTVSFNGFVGNDTQDDLAALPIASTSATQASDVGDYNIELSGGTSDNYEFELNNGTLTVTKSDLTATADDKIKNKGEDNPEFTISYNGFKNDDGPSSLDETPTATSNATASSDRGTYDITMSGGSDGNYSLTLQDGTLTVTGPVYTLPGQLDFVETGLGLSTEMTLTIDNTGDGALVISHVQVSGAFSANKANFAVAAGSSGTLTIQFSPTEAIAYNQVLTMVSNDGDLEVTLNGSGAIVTGLDDDILDEEEVQVYPNPTSQKVTIDMSSSPALVYDLSFMNLNGKVTWSRQGITARKTELLLDGYKPGVYLLKVQSDKGAVIKKVFVTQD